MRNLALLFLISGLTLGACDPKPQKPEPVPSTPSEEVLMLMSGELHSRRMERIKEENPELLRPDNKKEFHRRYQELEKEDLKRIRLFLHRECQKKCSKICTK